MSDAAALEWTGDLDDDCVCRVGGFVAHVECMYEPPGEGEDFDPLNDLPHEAWYCSVGRDDQSRETLFHSGDSDILPLTGKAARLLCELVIRAELAKQPK